MAGVAITPDGIAVAGIKRDAEQQPHLVHCEYYPLAGQAEFSQSLQRLLNNAAFNNMQVTTCLLPGEFTLQMMEAPDVAADELKDAVRWRIKDQLEFDLNEAVIDVFEIPGQKERGRRPMVYVVAARKQTVKQYIKDIENTGAELCCIDIPELLQRNIAARLAEDARGVAMLSLSADAGLLTLTHEGVLYLARELDVGYRAMQAPGSQGGGTDASGLQLEENLTPDQQRAFDTIILEVQRSLDYFESHFALPPIGHLVIAPLPEPVNGMLTYMGSNLGLPIKFLDMNDILEVGAPLDQQTQAQSFMAIGAALRSEA